MSNLISKKAFLIYIIAVLLLSSLLVTPIRGSQSFSIIRLQGTIEPSSKTYVYRNNGNFYAPNGSQINFFGFNYLPSAAFGDMSGGGGVGGPQGWVYPCEDDFRDLNVKGVNLIRLYINWALLEPTEGVFNSSYWNIIAQTIRWSEEYGIYILLDLHQPPPDWLNSFEDTLLGEGRQELAEVWQYIASEVQFEPNVLGYDLPYNEPTMSPSLALELKHDWNNWLKQKFDTIQNLNSTWRGGLNSSETVWGNIFPPRFVTGEPNPQERFNYLRCNEWYLFQNEIMSKFTQEIMDAVYSIDKNHLFGYEAFIGMPYYQVNSWFEQAPPLSLIPNRTDFFTPHFYSVHVNEVGIDDQTKLSGLVYDWITTFHAVAPEIPLIIGEVGCSDSETDFWKSDFMKMVLEQSYKAGVKGILWWCYYPGTQDWSLIEGETGVPNPVPREYKQNYQFLNSDWPKLFKTGLDARNPEALLVAPMSPVFCLGQIDGILTVGSILQRFNVDYDIILDLSLLENPDVLNRYKAVIVDSLLLNRTALDEIISWNEANSSNYVLWTGGVAGDSYLKWEDPCNVFNNYLVSTGWSPYYWGNDKEGYTLDAKAEWQTFSAGESFNWTRKSPINPRLDSALFLGTTVLSYTVAGKEYVAFGYNETRRTAVFFDSFVSGYYFGGHQGKWTNEPSDPIICNRVIDSFLQYAKILT